VDARVDALQARVDELEALLVLGAPAPAAPAPPAGGAPGATGSTAAGQGRLFQSMNPDLSFIADVAAAHFSSGADNRQTGGHDPTANGFNLQQLELAVSSIVDPYFRFDSNLVFSLFGVEIEEVYGTTLGLPLRGQVRVGQFLTKFGRVNATHPHSWDFVDQPFAIGRVFGGEGNRGLGVEGSVLLPLPWFTEVIVSQTVAGGEATARSFYGAQDLGVSRPTDLQTTAVIEQFFPVSADLGLLWGLSYAGGPNPSGATNRSEVYGTDVFFRFRPVTRGSNLELDVSTEWLHRRRQVPGDVLADWNGLSSVVVHFSPRWAVAARHELGTAARGLDGALADDPLDPEWSALRQRVSSNLTFWPTEFSRLRVQGARDAAGWDRTPDWSAFLAVEFVTGAHGAHHF
jgi:hypothetical protein